MVEVIATGRLARLVRRSGRAGGRRDDCGCVGLQAPLSSAINSRYVLRELRTQARVRPFRTFYIFDVERAVVLLIGGDKTGEERFYDRMIPSAERIWEQYKRERGSK